MDYFDVKVMFITEIFSKLFMRQIGSFLEEPCNALGATIENDINLSN